MHSRIYTNYNCFLFAVDKIIYGSGVFSFLGIHSVSQLISVMLLWIIYRRSIMKLCFIAGIVFTCACIY